MQKKLTFLGVLLISLACSKADLKDGLRSEQNKNEIPEGLQELLTEDNSIQFREIEIFDASREVSANMFVASSENDFIQDYISNNNLELKPFENVQLKFESANNSQTVPNPSNLNPKGIVSIFFDEDFPSGYSLSVRRKDVGTSKANLRSGGWTYDHEYQSNNYQDYVRVTRFPATGSSSNPADISLTFYEKAGWLGRWFDDKRDYLTGDYEHGDYCDSNNNAYRLKVRIQNNWTNYTYYFSNTCP